MSRCVRCSGDLAVSHAFCPSCGTAVTQKVGDDSGTPTGTAPRGRVSPTPGGTPPGTRTPSPTPRFSPGALLAGRYRVLGLVGRGGMGEVYRVEDLKLGQEAALKFLPEQLQEDPERLERLYGEVRFARQISHPNVCRVHDIGEVGGQAFISMEYVDGENLAGLLRRIGRLPGDKALEIARELCLGLAAAHDKKVLHRDLKPENVMIDGRGHVRITDFGLAGLADAIHGDDVRSGTPAYMSPEQLAGNAVSVKSDVYSLGLVLYELFTGRKAFSGRSFAEIVESRESLPERPSSLVADVNPAVERVIQRCLEKDPGQRPPSVVAVAAALPGGDLLAAALAAGETPSPELVAAAGERGVISARAGWASVLTILLGTSGVFLLMPRTSLVTSVPFEKPTAVLLDRARLALRAVAPVEAPGDEAWGLAYDDDYLRYVSGHDKSAKRWAGLATGRPAVLFFWYRQSPAPLLATNTPALVSANDPPPLLPGMEGVNLDTSGRLIELYAVPPQAGDGGGPGVKPDWSRVFSEAGLEPSLLAPVPSRWTPPVYADSRDAWDGTFPERPDLPIHVEAASYRGRAVFFKIVGAWTRDARERSTSSTTGVRLANYIAAVLMLGVFGATVGLARRNLQLGRGDRQGAFRLSSYGFVSGLLFLVLSVHHVRDLWGEIDLSFRGIGYLLAISGLIWLFYVAIEPFLRKRWPARIVAWTRLIAGGFRDPLVGRDVLIGVVWGVLQALLAQCLRLLPGWMSLAPTVPRFVDPDPLLGPRCLVGDLVGTQLAHMALGLGLLVFVLVLTSVLKRDLWVGVVVVALAGTSLALTLGSGAGAAPTVVIFVAGAALATFAFLALIRFGVLAFLVGFWVESVLIGYPLTGDTASWYFGLSSIVVLLILALAGYGLVTALAGKSLIGREFLPD